MKKHLALVGVLLASALVCSAEERPAQPAAAGRDTAARGGGLSMEEMGKRVADMQARLEKESQRITEDSARLKDDPEAALLLPQIQAGLASAQENLKAQAAAVQAGDQDKLKALTDQARDIERAGGKLRNALQLCRQAAEARNAAQSLPPLAGDGAASRQKYLETLNALAEFYAQQAKNPPESGRGGLSPENLARENTRKLERDRAKIEFDYQNTLANLNAMAEKGPDPVAAKTACSTVIQKAGALRDAQLGVVDAQTALVNAQVVQAQAAQALEQEKQAMLKSLHAKGGNERGGGAPPPADGEKRR